MDALPSPRLARKASSIPPSLSPVLKSLGLEEEDPEEVFEIHSKEGAGAFGRVFRATYRRDPSKVAALKVIPVALEAGQRGEDIENVRREIQFLRECDHPNVVAFFGAYYKDSALWVAMEYCGGGSVGDVSRRRRLEEDEVAVIMRGALQGLAYLHARKKIHRDIKGGNILLTSDGLVKIADFGVSAQLKDTMSRRGTFVGTPYWMSPEMIQDSDYDYKSDIWSLGITMIELADQKPPLFDEHPMRVLIQIPRNPPPSVKAPQSWTSLFIEFLQFCLRKDPKERPSAVECLDHAFIQRVADIVGVFAEGFEARRAISAATAAEAAMGTSVDETEEERAETVDSVLTSASANNSTSGKDDSEAMADDVTLKASAARPPRPAIQNSSNTKESVKPEVWASYNVGPPMDRQPTKEEEVDSDVGTPRNSESVVEDVWDHSRSAAITSSQSSRSDRDDDDEATDGNDASIEGFAFRQGPPINAASVLAAEEPISATQTARTPRDEMLELSMDDESFEMPALALISRIHAAANTLAGQGMRNSTPATATGSSTTTVGLPVPLQAAPSPILRGNKKTSVDTTRFHASEAPAPAATGPPRRDLSSFSKFDSFNRSSHPASGGHGTRNADLPVDEGRSHHHNNGWSNPLADLVPPSHDRVNSLLSSISASSSRLSHQPQSNDVASSMEFTPLQRGSLRGSAMGSLVATPATSSTLASSNLFIGAPFRVSHQLCVKYNTLDAKFEGAPASSEWATIHRQFGIPLAQMHCRTNSRDHVPALLHMLRRELVRRDGLDCKYIYRVSPEQSAVLHAKQTINGGVFDAASVSDPHVFASLIKHWLRELPTPLLAAITRQDLATAVQSLVKPEDEDAGVVAATVEFARPFQEIHAYVTAKVLDKLPVAERGLLLWLVDHMIEVMDKSSRNAMTAQSLAVVMAPNVYRWASATPADASLISKQVATLLRVLLAWRQQCQGSSSSAFIGEDAGRSVTLRGRPGSRGTETAASQAWTGSAGSTTSVRDSLNGLRESLNSTISRDSTVSSLLRRSSLGEGVVGGLRTPHGPASHFVSATTGQQSWETGASGPLSSSTEQQRSSPPLPLHEALRELVDALWNELPQSLLLTDKPPIVRSLHVNFQKNVLTVITQGSKREGERRWASRLLDRIDKHECVEYESEAHSVPIGLCKLTRWLQAALSVDAFVKLLSHERNAKERLTSHWPKHDLSKSADRTPTPLTPEHAFAVSHVLTLGASMGNSSDLQSSGREEEHIAKKQVDGVLMDGAATFVKVLHKSLAASGRAATGSKSLPLAEDVARLAEQEPSVGQLLVTLSDVHMRRFHLDKEQTHQVAMMARMAALL